MAGAGFKTFNTGDVLTSSDVNTYLMQQTVMVFDDAAARTTALSGVVSEGMLSYLKDTNAVEVYDGSSWVASDDPNAIQNSIVDAKGDLISASADNVPARLAVGNAGETIVADSSATTGLRWQGSFEAGKNKIINGDFNINQRGFSSTTTSATYGFDRFQMVATDGTVTYSAQTFTAGAAPVAGYEATNFARLVSSGQTANNARALLQQQIENVRNFANQTVTVSFWAKASTGTPSVAASFVQNFGTSGSTSVVVAAGKTAITTSWARYSFTVAIPSISGKTITSDSSLILRMWISAGSDNDTATTSLGIQSATIDFWGVQVEAGSVATPFTTATGTLAGELAACQRYYYRYVDGNTQVVGFGGYYSATNFNCYVPFKVSMRTAPSLVVASGTDYYYIDRNSGTDTINDFFIARATPQGCFLINDTQASGTAGHAGAAGSNNASASIAFNSEL